MGKQIVEEGFGPETGMSEHLLVLEKKVKVTLHAKNIFSSAKPRKEFEKHFLHIKFCRIQAQLNACKAGVWAAVKCFNSCLQGSLAVFILVSNNFVLLKQKTLTVVDIIREKA